MNEQDIRELYQALAREYSVKIQKYEWGGYNVAHPRNVDDILVMTLPDSFEPGSRSMISASYITDERESPEEIIEGLQLLASLRDQLVEKGYTPRWLGAEGNCCQYEVMVDIRNANDVEKALKDYRDLKL